MTAPVAFITGITGQDGSYLTENLLARGYTVHGAVRRTSVTSRERLRPLFDDPEIYDRRLFLHYADLEDTTTLRRLLIDTRPDELYHLAGQSHVAVSFQTPESTCRFTAMATLGLLEILRDLEKRPRLLHISSSEIFGRPEVSPQDESTPMNPVTPYGIAKAFATQMVRLYREAYGVFAVNAICYNHESPRRGESFVTRKITRGVADIVAGRTDHLTLGNLDAARDWGYAPEYVEAMRRTLARDTPDDYVLATGTHHTIREFLNAAFSTVNLDWRDYVRHDDKYERPGEVTRLVGDPGRAAKSLDWTAEVKLPELAELMVRADLAGGEVRQHP